jgi:glycosyltransferase involved in cell wall biosynthesis
MAAGVPVISTSVGAEGLEAIDGRDLLLADTPPAMVEAVDRLLGEPVKRAQLAANGLELAERYDWRRVVPQFLELYDNIAAGSR